SVIVSRYNLENKAFQIERFWDCEQDRVIGGLEPTFQHAHPAPCIIGGICQHFCEQPLADMVRARTCNKDASWTQQPHGSVIDLLVTPERTVETVLAFGKRRRIENDGVVSDAFFVPVAQEIKCIRFDTVDVLEPI